MGFGILSLCVRKRNKSTQNLAIVAYNYLFLATLYTADCWLQPCGWADGANILLGGDV